MGASLPRLLYLTFCFRGFWDVPQLLSSTYIYIMTLYGACFWWMLWLPRGWCFMFNSGALEASMTSMTSMTSTHFVSGMVWMDIGGCWCCDQQLHVAKWWTFGTWSLGIWTLLATLERKDVPSRATKFTGKKWDVSRPGTSPKAQQN